VKIKQVYSPLAHALGVGKWLWELEDLSFRALFPDSYADLEQWQLDLWDESSEMMVCICVYREREREREREDRERERERR